MILELESQSMALSEDQVSSAMFEAKENVAVTIVRDDQFSIEQELRTRAISDLAGFGPLF